MYRKSLEVNQSSKDNNRYNYAQKLKRMVKYFTPDEVAMHNCAEDCWVSIYHNVYDITSLIGANRGVLADPLIKEAGRSISHWFHEKTGDIKTYIDPIRNISMPYTPNGRFIHVPPADPMEWSTQYELPWWKDPNYIIGKVIDQFNKSSLFNYFIAYHKNQNDTNCKYANPIRRCD